MFINILLLTLFGSLLSLLGGFILIFKKTWNEGFSLKLTSFAAGTLLGTAFLDLFPEALEHIEETGGGDIFLPALIGIIVFFLMERSFVWFHHHHEAHDIKPTVLMVIVGDGLHNFIDGVAIASAYMINPVIGLTTAIAVAAHEIPQEIADFSILLSRGLKKHKALIFNVLSSLTSLLGALGMLLAAQLVEAYLPYIIAFTAGMFSYIALSDLIPELHHSNSKKDTLPQIFAFIVGILLVVLVKYAFGNFVHSL